MSTCILDGCDKPGRNKSGTALCPMHYHRQYRHGDVEACARSAAASGVTASHGRRYRTQYLPQHPLADKQGKVYVHRAVLYDEIGLGPHACHWCQALVDWLPKGDPRAIQVDHLNGVGDDNRAENLVASCGRCNSARGSQTRHDALVAAGYWSQHDTVGRNHGRAPRVA